MRHGVGDGTGTDVKVRMRHKKGVVGLHSKEVPEEKMCAARNEMMDRGNE